MVFEAIVDVVADLVLVVGVPLLVVLFFLEGLILGKVLQAPAVFVTVVAIARPSRPSLVLLAAGCTLAVVLGQWTILRSFDPNAARFLGMREQWPRLERLPDQVLARLGEPRVAMVDRWFTRYGGLAVFVTTFLPVVRGTLAVPAGWSTYPRGRFLAVTLTANAAYFLVLTAIAFGILHVMGM